MTLEGERPAAAFGQLAQGNDEFTKWFKAEVREIHGIDFDAPPAIPAPTLVSDSGPVD